MMLFARFQVEEFAYKKWGGPEGLDTEWERRTAEAKKRKGKKFAQNLRELRRKTRESVWQMKKDEEHKHQFGAMAPGSDASGVQKRVARGLEIEVAPLACRIIVF